MLHLACAELKDWEWFSVESTISDNPNELLVRLVELKPDVLCSTLYLFNSQFVLELLQRFKAVVPECPVLVGGPECLGNAALEVLQRSTAIDCAFSGEGEEALALLLDSIANGSFPTAIPGAFYRNALEQTFLPASTVQIYSSWEESLAPASSPFFNLDKPFVQMETSRGCPQSCIYCTSCRSKVRNKSIEQVREELTMLSAKKVKEIRLLDRSFNLPPTRAVKLLQLFREEFPELNFHLEIHPEFLNSELCEELKKANFQQLHLEAGIQSFDQLVLNACGRGGNTDKAREGLIFLASCKNFDTHADLLAGLPEQNWQTLLNDIKSMLEIAPAEIQLEILKVLPGTELRAQAEELKIRYNPETPYEVLQTADLSVEELYKAAILSRMLDLFYNQKYLQEIFRKLAQNNENFVEDFFAYLLEKDFTASFTASLRKRFLLLAEYIKKHCQEEGFSLAIQWLKAGLSTSDLPFYELEKLDALPCGFKLIEGQDLVKSKKNTRLWLLKNEDTAYVFAFNRAISMQFPCAMWIRE